MKYLVTYLFSLALAFAAPPSAPSGPTSDCTLIVQAGSSGIPTNPAATSVVCIIGSQSSQALINSTNAGVEFRCSPGVTITPSNSAGLFVIAGIGSSILGCSLSGSGLTGIPIWVKSSGVTIAGGTISGWSSNTNHRGLVYISCGSNVVVRDVTILGSVEASIMAASADCPIDNLLLDHNSINSTQSTVTGNAQMEIQGTALPNTNGKVTRNDIRAAGTFALRAGNYAPVGYSYTDNTLGLAAAGSLYACSQLNGFTQSTYIGNKCIGDPARAINIGHGVSDCLGGVVANNTTLNVWGVAIQSIDDAGCAFTGNILEGFGTAGIQIYNNVGVMPNRRIVVANNILNSSAVSAIPMIDFQCNGISSPSGDCGSLDIRGNQLTANSASIVGVNLTKNTSAALLNVTVGENNLIGVANPVANNGAVLRLNYMGGMTSAQVTALGALLPGSQVYVTDLGPACVPGTGTVLFMSPTAKCL